MKRILVLSALFLSMYGFSQSREKGTIEVAPFVGYASSNFFTTSYSAYEAISSVNFGLNGDYFFSNRWSLRSGLLYQTMGTKHELNYLDFASYDPEISDNSTFKQELKYLTVPINANWHFGSTRKWNLNFGPSIGFLLSSKDSEGNSSTMGLNTVQIGFNFGIGYKIEVSDKFSILIEHQEMLGLSNVFNDSSGLTNIYGNLNVGGVFKL